LLAEGVFELNDTFQGLISYLKFNFTSVKIDEIKMKIFCKLIKCKNRPCKLNIEIVKM